MDPTNPDPNTVDHEFTLEFDEFSYLDDKEVYRRIGTAWLHKLYEYLEEHYQAVSVSERLPYLVVWCKHKVPPPSERPSKIAGLFAIWLVEGDKYPEVRTTSYLLIYAREPYTNFPVVHNGVWRRGP